ncbi:MAG: sigma factor-like helix-turn-helix DNA-binding protein, partial [Deltaproteobacteria bacterium]|nr:sigma factor-like helix-turn-helix DNA-binding protein [Deltaproteobacteria bacterium]
FRLIKIGTTKDQKKLFYNLIREKQRMEALGYKPTKELLAKQLQVSEEAVEEMNKRLTQPEIALETPVGESGTALLMDFIPVEGESTDEMISAHETKDILKEKLAEFTKKLNEKEMKIFHERLIADLPITLQEIGDEYSISKERVRQIEERLLQKLREFFKEKGIKAEMLHRE